MKLTTCSTELQLHSLVYVCDLAMTIFIACTTCKISLWFPSGSAVGVASSLGYVILCSVLIHLFLCKWSFLVYHISVHYFTMIFMTVLQFVISGILFSKTGFFSSYCLKAHDSLCRPLHRWTWNTFGVVCLVSWRFVLIMEYHSQIMNYSMIM